MVTGVACKEVDHDLFNTYEPVLGRFLENFKDNDNEKRLKVVNLELDGKYLSHWH